mmetsp:Transcript_6034/g.9426  ORF Transcript_6034/g.9426 Transcript_6034/m.9426 type:complete len:96 (+) Transcript_6034:3692-3979(+)
MPGCRFKRNWLILESDGGRLTRLWRPQCVAGAVIARVWAQLVDLWRQQQPLPMLFLPALTVDMCMARDDVMLSQCRHAYMVALYHPWYGKSKETC